MSQEFQKRLQGSAFAGDAGVVALNDAQAIVELNQTMARYASKVAGHPYASAWYSWPVGWRGIYFWTDDAQKKTGSADQSRIYLLPNLVVWWLGTFAILRLLVLLIPRLVAAGLRRPHAPIAGPELLIAFGYFCCLAPFAAIDRPMFLYHYFPALLCSLLAGAVQARSITRPLPVAAALVASFALMFAWMSPLVYGEPLTQSQLGKRMLMKAWP
jgi:dolichyl-phosphate-mannose-protein mannosyltransferase